MGGFTVHIEGLRELDAKLSEMKDAQVKRVIRQGLDAGGDVMRAAIAEAAPVRPDLPSEDALPPGALKQDIEVRRGRFEGLLAVFIGPGKFTRRQAGWVEYGHRLVRGGTSQLVKTFFGKLKYKGPGQEVDVVKAHPFIRPTYEAVREEAVQVAVDTMRRGVGLAAIANPGLYEGRGAEENYSGEEY
jgi:HK97 gp10 family phage protein